MVSEELQILRQLKKTDDQVNEDWELVNKEIENERFIPNIELNWIFGAIILKMYMLVGLLVYLLLFKIGETELDPEIIFVQLKIFMYITLGEFILIIYQILLRPVIKWIIKKIKGRNK